MADKAKQGWDVTALLPHNQSTPTYIVYIAAVGTHIHVIQNA